MVIVGAGPAGLTTAYQLLKKGSKYKVIVIEKEDCVGGISKTLSYKGNRMDLGGHRFFSKIKEINELWLELLEEQGEVISKELEPPQKNKYPGRANPNNSEDVMLIRRRVSRIYYLRKFFDYPIAVNCKTLTNMGVFRTIISGLGYVWSLIFKRKEESLEDFYINRFGKPLYKMFFKDYTTKLWGISPEYLAPDWGSQRVKQLSLFKTIKDAVLRKLLPNYTTNESSLIEEFYYPKYGPGQLWGKMASKIVEMGGEIHLNVECRKIHVDKNQVTKVVVQDNKVEEKEIECNYIVSSMAIKDLFNCLDSQQPQEIVEVANSLPYRDFITIGVLVEELELKNKTNFETLNKLIPDCWIYIQEKNIKMGRMQIFNNWSPYMVAEPQKMVWIGLEYFCSEGDELWTMTNKEFSTFAIDELVQMGIVRRDKVIDFTVHRVQKAYPAYYGSYKDMPKLREYIDGFQNLLCVGRNGQHRYNNMDHSMMTGILAADAICGNVSKEQVWNVNTESTYQEEENE